MTPETFPKGTLIDGRYDIRELVGRGGMGAVYRAVDTKLGQTVAVKMLLPSSGDSRSRDDRRRRFFREVVAINEVQHRNVVYIREFGFHDDTPYMVMEFLNGKDLGKVLRDSNGPLPIERVVDLLLVVCAAIRACHAVKVIHRDLKPGNVMVIETDAGIGWDVKVVDFSISKSADTRGLTHDGDIVGTPLYLSPEQIAGSYGPESDQYAIGVMLYVCLTHHHPYEGHGGLPLIRAIEKGAFKHPRELRPEIPAGLEEIVLKAMRVAPADRHRSVFELGQRLWNFASPLGRQNWKKYYFETPDRPHVIDAKGSTVGIPLIRQMVDASLPFEKATVSANFVGATVLETATRTVDDLEPRPAKAVSDLAPTRTYVDSAPIGSGHPPRRLKLAAALIVLIATGGILGAAQLNRRPRHEDQVAPATATAPPAMPAMPALPPAAAPAPHVSVAPPSEPRAEPAPPARAKRTPRNRRPRTTTTTGNAGEWDKDANGIPIPPM